jgi:methyl-accepting chemotaxis protein
MAVVKDELAQVEEADRRISGAIEQLQATEHAAAATDALQHLVASRQAYAVHEAELVRLVLAQSLDEGGVYLTRSMLPAQDAYLSAIAAFAHLQTEAMERFGEEAARMAVQGRATMIGLAAVAALLAAGIAVLMTRSITVPISQAVAVAKTVARGDLTSAIDVRRADEAGQLLGALQRMNDGLAGIVSQVRESSDSIATGASEMASGNSDLSRRTEEQAASLQQTVTAVDQASAMSQRSADSAAAAAQIARDARAAALKGEAAIRQVVDTMTEIAMGARRITEITGVIDGIALQTNILALNAAVEGARGAEQGRGFAVVAGEVRALAQRAAVAAKDIKALIAASVEKTEAGTRLVEDAGGTMEEIIRHVDQVARRVGEIDAVAQEQRGSLGRISDAVSELDRMTRRNAALVEESAAATESLSAQAARLADVVRSFKLGRIEAGDAALRPPMADATECDPAA